MASSNRPVKKSEIFIIFFIIYRSNHTNTKSCLQLSKKKTRYLNNYNFFKICGPSLNRAQDIEKIGIQLNLNQFRIKKSTICGNKNAIWSVLKKFRKQ